MRKFIGTACVVLGILCLLSAVGLVLYNRHEAKTAADASADMLLSIQQQLAKNEADAPTQPGNSPAIMPVTQYNGYDCIGILSIPVLELELPVLSGWSYEQLKLAPCQYYGSCYDTDFVIAAHNYDTHFGRLNQLQAEDIVIFTDLAGESHYYEIALLETLPPHATEEMLTSGFDLSLYTCTPGGANRVTARCVKLS